MAEFEKTPADMQKIAPDASQAALVLVANTLINLDSVISR
jgi:hypothetical protein